VSTAEPSTSHFWLWTFFFLLIIAGVVGAGLFVYRRRGFHTKFNLNMYFRNNELFHEFSNNEKQPSSQQPHSIFPRFPPALISNMGKNYEVINDDCNTTHQFENLQSMQNFSDEEFVTESELNNDQNQRLIV
jgi:hypothetical protein